MTPSRPLLRYHGGKWKLAPWIISHFPEHSIYVEPFGGAASVLLRKQRIGSEVYNDMDGNVVTLFRLLREPSKLASLREACALTPFAREEFELSFQPTEDEIERARRFIVRSFFGYGSKVCFSETRNGFRCLRSGDAAPAVDWARYPEAINLIAKRMKGVVIEHKPALDVIRRFDRPQTLFYCDPPYVHSTRNLRHGAYRHELSDTDHAELAAALASIQGMALVSGYECPLYADLYAGWHCVRKTTYADKGAPRTECLWISPNASAAMPQQSLLEGV